MCVCVCVSVSVCVFVCAAMSHRKLSLDLFTCTIRGVTHKWQLTRERRQPGWRQPDAEGLPATPAGRRRHDWCDSAAWCCKPAKHTTVSTYQPAVSQTLLCQHINLLCYKHCCVNISACCVTNIAVSTYQPALSQTVLCQHTSLHCHKHSCVNKPACTVTNTAVSTYQPGWLGLKHQLTN